MSPGARLALESDAPVIAEMLDAFNREFETPTPGPEVLEERLRRLLARDNFEVVLAGDQPAGLAIITFRPSIWDAGPAALLEELYVRAGLRNQGIGHELVLEAMSRARHHGSETFEINVDEGDLDAIRFYERHGFSAIQPETQGRALYFSRSLAEDSPPRSEPR